MATKFKAFTLFPPFKGLVLDRTPRQLEVGEFSELDQFHIFDGAIIKYSGWEECTPTKGLKINCDELLTGHFIFGYDFEKSDLSRVLLLGSEKNLFIWPHTGSVTPINVTDFNGTLADGWQQVQMHNKLYLTNRVDPIQAFDGTAVNALSGDASMPSFTYCLGNCVNHLIAGRTTESAIHYPRRVRFSHLDDATIWVDTEENEAGYIDFPTDIGKITGMANLGQNTIMIYGDRGIYAMNYVGWPAVFTVEKKISDEGLIAPRSLASAFDVHFFLGNRDFFMYSGGSNLKPLGFDRVISSFFGNFDKAADAGYLYSFVHPLYQEIWWIYVSKDSIPDDDGNKAYDKALIYNFQSDTWCQRKVFPMSFVCPVLSTTQRTIADATNSIGEAVGTWRDKQGRGTWILLSGD